MAKTDTHILVIDDDDRIRGLLKTYLGRQGYHVSVAANAQKARKMMAGLQFDLMVVDVMMPGEDGISFTRALSPDDGAPILLLTARGAPDERIEGLRAGADDYLAKPFEPEELLLRIEAILRRSKPPLDETMSLVFGPWHYTPASHELTGPQGRVPLTGAEARLLNALAKTPAMVVGRSALSRSFATSERAIDVQMARLRRKIEADPRHPQHLQTLRGAGYRLMARFAPKRGGA